MSAPANDNATKAANIERSWRAFTEVARAEFSHVDFSVVVAVSSQLGADCDAVDGWLPESYWRSRARSLFLEKLGRVARFRQPTTAPRTQSKPAKVIDMLCWLRARREEA